MDVKRNKISLYYDEVRAINNTCEILSQIGKITNQDVSEIVNYLQDIIMKYTK